MANIRVDVNYTIKDGSEIVFRSPVDCSAVTGLIVYYLGEDGNTTSKEFALADAHGNNVGDIPHLFAENVVVKVILDVTSGMAFVQNADTNAYLEGRFDELLPREALPTAINEALAQAKASGVFDGEQGPKGEKGDTGPKGDKGDKGADGTVGADGKSAYQYAQDGGYTGTEEEFAAKLASDGHGTTMTLLWENASPTSEFSPQTIAVDFSGFSHFFVIFKMSISATQHDSVFGKVGYNFLMHSEYVETGAAKRQGLFSDAGIDFSKATIWQPNNGNIDNNNYAIPREIYGIKGVIE